MPIGVGLVWGSGGGLAEAARGWRRRRWARAPPWGSSSRSAAVAERWARPRPSTPWAGRGHTARRPWRLSWGHGVTGSALLAWGVSQPASLCKGLNATASNGSHTVVVQPMRSPPNRKPALRASSEAGGPAFLLSTLAVLLAGRESPGLALLVDLLPGVPSGPCFPLLPKWSASGCQGCWMSGTGLRYAEVIPSAILFVRIWHIFLPPPSDTGCSCQ